MAAEPMIHCEAETAIRTRSWRRVKYSEGMAAVQPERASEREARRTRADDQNRPRFLHRPVGRKLDCVVTITYTSHNKKTLTSKTALALTTWQRRHLT